MKSRPILFSAPMVRAILAGEKTQTRRVVKPQPSLRCQYDINGAKSHAICQSTNHPGVFVPPTPKSADHRLPCLYGQPGDQLWVREAFRIYDSTKECACYDDCKCSKHHGQPVFRATSDDTDEKWKPSIHMPRWASRITLEITNIRVERLHEITAHDALAEGVGHSSMGNPVFDYEILWESINGPGSWGNNPWVWVVEFRKI